jgi:hypothetical protein
MKLPRRTFLHLAAGAAVPVVLRIARRNLRPDCLMVGHAADTD